MQSDCDLEKTETGLGNSVGSISTQELHYDLEKSGVRLPPVETEPLDIEHVPVQNDPRKWSALRKVRLKVVLTQLESSVLDSLVFCCLECYSSIDLFCIYNRWNCSQYTKP